MGSESLRRVTGLAAIVLFGLVLVSCVAPGPSAAPSGDNLRVEEPFARPAAAGQNGAAYFTIVNPTQEADQLVAVAGDIAMHVELHESVNDGGVMRMIPHPEGFPVAPGTTLQFQPGGKHVMLMNLNRALTPGESFDLVLTFANAGEIKLTVPVQDR